MGARPLLSVAEVSRLTGRSGDVIRRWIREGTLPAVQDADFPYAYRVASADLARIAGRRRWRRGTKINPAIPGRLARVAGVTGAWTESTELRNALVLSSVGSARLGADHAVTGLITAVMPKADQSLPEAVEATEEALK